MRLLDPRTKVCAIAGASLTLLAIVFGAPSSSRADCRHPSDRPAISIGIDALLPDGPPADSVPKPCDGPQCSGKSAPPMTPTPQSRPRVELWALTIEPAPSAGPDPSVGVVEDCPARPISMATSVFHPPRLPR